MKWRSAALAGLIVLLFAAPARGGRRSAAALRRGHVGVVRGDDRRAVRAARRHPQRRRHAQRADLDDEHRRVHVERASSPSGSGSSASASSCDRLDAHAGDARAAWSARAERPVLQLVRPPHGREARRPGRRPARRSRRSCPRSTTAGWPSACGSSRTACPSCSARAQRAVRLDGLRLLLPARASTGSCSTTCPTPARRPCCYDTVVSESRIADYIGIAQGQIPQKAYFGALAHVPGHLRLDAGRRPGRSASTRTYFGVDVFEGALPVRRHARRRRRGAAACSRR